MTELFRRAYKLKIGTIMIDGTSIKDPPLSISFKVSKSIKKEPNSLVLNIYNLSEMHRKQIESMRELPTSSLPIELSAGYAENIELIFSGDLRIATSKKKKKKKTKGKYSTSRGIVDIVTEIEAEDGGRTYRDSRISKGYAPGVSPLALIRDCATAMGIGAGNLNDFSALTIPGLGATYPQGTALYGRARSELDRIVRSIGCQWSIQHGNLQLTSRNIPLKEQAFLLNSNTGLLESPQKENDGTIIAKTLMIPDLAPGRKVVIQSKDIRDQCTIKRVEFIGDYSGEDWFAHLELRGY